MENYKLTPTQKKIVAYLNNDLVILDKGFEGYVIARVAHEGKSIAIYTQDTVRRSTFRSMYQKGIIRETGSVIADRVYTKYGLNR